MDRAQIEALLNEVHAGSTSVMDALERLRNLPFEDLGFAKVDHHRSLRTGMPEVIFSESKTTAQVAAIFSRMAKAGGNVLATRASRAVYEAVASAEPRAPALDEQRADAMHQVSFSWEKRIEALDQVADVFGIDEGWVVYNPLQHGVYYRVDRDLLRTEEQKHDRFRRPSARKRQ